jgi:hypothetical protein
VEEAILTVRSGKKASIEIQASDFPRPHFRIIRKQNPIVSIISRKKQNTMLSQQMEEFGFMSLQW